MVRKVLLLFCVWFMVDMLVVACCPGSGYVYSTILNLNLTNADLHAPLPDQSDVQDENFRIQLKMEMDVITYSAPTLTNRMFALSCPEPSIVGLKNKLSKVQVSCDKKIFDIEPGHMLNDKVMMYMATLEEDASNLRRSIDSWIGLHNSGEYGSYQPDWYLEFQEEIESDEFLTFSLFLEFEDNTFLEASTESVRVN